MKEENIKLALELGWNISEEKDYVKVIDENGHVMKKLGDHNDLNQFLKHEDFNRKSKWYVLYEYNKRENNKVIVRARCSCGNEKDIELNLIKSSKSLSCGCN